MVVDENSRIIDEVLEELDMDWTHMYTITEVRNACREVLKHKFGDIRN
jgi:hypothetical protein